jgi:indole-3-glycerol phosphate synthase
MGEVGGVLADIAAATKRRLEREKARTPEAALRTMLSAQRQPRDFRGALGPGGLKVIAEVKLASPSEGALGSGLGPAEVARAYCANGAAAISVLTEPDFFLGRIAHLTRIREQVPLPLLMKDFFLEAYQLLQARVFGADCALLIVALLGKEKLRAMLREAGELGLDALVEVHDERELEAALEAGALLIGVNNRDLRTLQVDLDVSRRLAPLGVKGGALLISESGLRSRAQLEELAALGYRGFLVGTHLIKSGRPGDALAALLGREPAP